MVHHNLNTSLNHLKFNHQRPNLAIYHLITKGYTLLKIGENRSCLTSLRGAGGAIAPTDPPLDPLLYCTLYKAAFLL